MNNVSAIDAYASAFCSTLVGRRLEAHVLLRTADRLQRVINGWDTPDREVQLREAVSRVHTLWTMFLDSLADSSNSVPDELKASLVNIGLFIDHRLCTALADPSPDKLATVIQIHRQLAAGLNTVAD